MNARKREGRERGQILIPSLFLLPSLFLFVILLFETGRISREKIRHQFALDAAASIEMAQYTDLVNRSAYVNGAFPDRIFKEVFGSSWGQLHRQGLFQGTLQQIPYEHEPVWRIRYGSGRAYGNSPNPPLNFGTLHMYPPGATMVIPIDDAVGVYDAFTRTFQMLGAVAISQKAVFERLTLDRHALLRKSMWLNLRDGGGEPGCLVSPESCGNEAAAGFKRIRIRLHYLQGFKFCPVVLNLGGTYYVGELTTPFQFSGPGLFQLTTVPPQDLRTIRKGFVIEQHWLPPSNYYKIDMKELYNPYVRALVTTSGGQVWPDSTPKYYTRLRP